MRALSNPHPLLGNGQHIPVAGLVLAAALFSVQFFEPPAPTKSLADASSNDRAQVLVAKEQFCEFSGMLYIYFFFETSCLLQFACQHKSHLMFVCRSKRIFPRWRFKMNTSFSELENMFAK